MTVVEETPDQQAGARAPALPTMPRDAAPADVVDAVRLLLQEITGRWLPRSESVSLPGGLTDLATTARVPTSVPYQLASLVIDLPLACASDPWSVAVLRAWVSPATLERLRVVPLHFDGVAVHYATADVPTPGQAAAVAEAFGLRSARPLLCTPESIGAWSLPTDPSRREARPAIDTALTASPAWMASLRKLPLPGSLVAPLGARVGIGASTAVVAGDLRATDLLVPLVGTLTGLPVAHADVPADVAAWLADCTDSPSEPTPAQLVEQLRCVPAGVRGLGWHAALSGLRGDQRVRIAGWALGAPWLSAEVAALVAAHRSEHVALTDPDWAVWPPHDNVGRTVIGIPPICSQPDPAREAYAAALLTRPVADCLPPDRVAEAMCRVREGVALDQALTEVAPEIGVSALLAEHVGLPTVDLDPRPRVEVGVDALGRTCRKAGWDDPVSSVEHSVLSEPDVVPVRHDPDGALLVAVADPLSPGLAERLAEHAARPVRIAVAARAEIDRARRRLLARRSLVESTLRSDLSSPHWDRVALHSAQWKVPPAQAILDLGLDVEIRHPGPQQALAPERVLRRPEDSAHQVLTPGQKAVLAMVGVIVGAALTLAPWLTLSALTTSATALLLAAGSYRIWEGARCRLRPAPRSGGLPEDPDQPPVMTVLIPLRRGEKVSPGLVARWCDYDYPADRLDVKLLVDSTEATTRAELEKIPLPSCAEMLVVPPSGPGGRFKAANVGLLHARGKYVALQDPGVRGQRTLLRQAAHAFRASAHDVVALQGGLRQRNGAPGPIGRLFAATYAITFGGLFALCRGRQPIPLGPTSTFFVTDWLRTAGGWDPHNRAAQADLGVRIRRLGGQVAALDGVVDHVVETDLRGWLRRSVRCIAGYTQTYLVHMRRPRQLRADLGLAGFIGFQCAVAGTLLAAVVQPILWTLIGLWALGLASWVPHLIPGPTHLGVSVLALSTGLFALAHLATRCRSDTAGWKLLLSPWYWSLRSAMIWRTMRHPVSRGR